MAEEKKNAPAAEKASAEKKPAPKKPAAAKKEPAAEKPAAKKPAAEKKAPAAAKPAAEKKASAAKPAAEKKPAAEAPAKKPAAPKTPAAEKAAPEKKAAPRKEPASEKKEQAPAKQDGGKATGKTVTVAEGKAPAAPALPKGRVAVTLKRALAGRTQSQIAVAASLGLKRRGDVSLQPDNAATAGKVSKIAFLLDVKKA